MAPYNFETEDDQTDPMDGLDTEDEATSEVIDGLTEPDPEVEAEQEVEAETADFDAQFREVEDRLQTAQYYRLLLNDSLFDVSDAAGRQVDTEIKAFVRERLEVLMGIRAAKPVVRIEKVEPQFGPEELAALKLVAKLCIEKNATKLAAAKPEKPKAEPALKKPKPEAKPAPKPVTPPQAPRPAPKPSPVVPKPKIPGLKKPTVPGSVRKLPIPAPAPKGKPAGPKPRAQDNRIPKKYRDDPTARVDKQGRVTIHARNDDGEVILNTEGQPMIRYVTEPAQPAPGGPQPIPQPTEMQAAMRAQEHAHVALNAVSNRYNRAGIGNIVQAAIVTPPTRPTEEQNEEEYQ